MTLFTLVVLGLIAAGCGMSICLLASRVEQLRRSIAVLELRSPRPPIGRRELQLIARLSTVLLQ